MKVLVTGGAGFIASHVADGYIEQGHDVAIVDDLSRGFERNLNPKARFHRGNIMDRAFLEHVFQQEKPEVINHHAAQMDVRRGVREPVLDASLNILGSINLLELAAEHKTKRVIYISTAGAAYGEPKTLPVSEDHPVNPITPYGISKHTVEHYLFTFKFLYGLDYVVLRYGNVYGPRQSSKGEAGVFAIFSEQMLAGVQPVIYGDGTKYRDYVYIEDAVRANLAALEHGAGEIFNIANGVPTTDYEVFAVVRDLLKKHVEPTYAPIRPGEIEKIVLDVSKAARLLSWRPSIALAEGAKRTVEFFIARANRENMEAQLPQPAPKQVSHPRAT
jgi:UDP-glucose 4-epimerase